MFRFQDGSTAEVLAGKKGYMKDPQRGWSFLTNYDLSTIKTEGQLCSMVKTRYSLLEAQTKADVAGWVRGKQF